jgi:hypothetical protein
MWDVMRGLWRGRGRGPSRATSVPAAEAARVEAPAPECPVLSRLIRAACNEPKTSVWWVVVQDTSASVYPLPADHPLVADEENE